MSATSTSIGDLVSAGALEFGDGYRTRRSEHGRPGFRIIRVADVFDNEVHFDGPDFVSHTQASAIGSKVGKTGDILLTTKGTVGRVAILPPTEEAVVYSPQLCYFRVLDHARVEPRFLRYWFSSQEFWDQASYRMNNTDMAAYLNMADIRSLKISLPRPSVQQGIAEVLGALDDKLATNHKLALTTEQLGAAKFNLLGLDVEPTYTGIALDELFDLNPRRVLDSETPTVIDMQALPTTIPLVGRWNTGVKKSGARFANGDTLIARITPCLENRKTAFVDFLGEGEVGIGSTEFVVMRSKNNLPLGLSYFMATSERFRDFAIQNLVGTSGRQRVSATDLARHTLSPVDPLELQSFGKWADANLGLLGALRNENQVLTTTRDSLLPQLMSGKLRVKDAEALVEPVV
ncbi:restriction endonuclease subunit S [Glutamicibacter arilaitensis]|uniref:restriction endonuclease subunit S n=1 Tax=Glutamicibacter arilaitensis TaxID=256701 RepID=UPI003FD2118D